MNISNPYALDALFISPAKVLTIQTSSGYASSRLFGIGGQVIRQGRVQARGNKHQMHSTAVKYHASLLSQTTSFGCGSVIPDWKTEVGAEYRALCVSIR